MKGIELVAFGSLWAVLIALGALVLMLYRQIDRAYQSQAQSLAGGLLPGVDAPEIEVLGAKSEEPLRFPKDDEFAVFAFVSVGCDACIQLLKVLRDKEVFQGRAVGLVNGQTSRQFGILEKQMELRWLAHPPDIVRNYGVTATPTVYVIRGRTVLASKVVSTKAGLTNLLDEAVAVATKLDNAARLEKNATHIVPV